MCLEIKVGTTRMVAKKDKKVYKRLEFNVISAGPTNFKATLRSPYQYMSYKPGNQYRSVLVSEFRKVEKGLHCHTSLSKAKSKSSTKSREIIFEMSIPEGAEYFLGRSQDIVSNRLDFPLDAPVYYRGKKYDNLKQLIADKLW